MQDFIDGFSQFRRRYYEDDPALFEALVREGQSPRIMVVSCCDSRVDPGLLFGARPGELFAVRNVANLVPPYEPDGGRHGTSAALEFAVGTLGVERIVVLGHARCGGVQALLQGVDGGGGGEFIPAWMAIARTARDRALALTLTAGQPMSAAQRICEQEVVAISLANLMTFPKIRQKVEAKELTLHGWYFDLVAGHLLHLDPMTNAYKRLEKAF